ncbi:undecaprenyl-diphosphatase [Undibacterium sp. FT147W]|uniref:Undecaprenyl-diphosphatase n=1 Tax=Undibacterium rivi TaxID=2828729 RepID=A0ABS5H2E9_9BURK|nr:undecaprenyl-diphosphatase [Undibacterium rivi]MBR7792144.1 undecaprenyl-diphosphatase [Undibacterium rivi]
MEDLNHALFLWLNAPGHPSTLVLAIATFFAEYAICALPVIIGFGWLRGNEHTRKVLLEATASGLAGLLINQIIGLVWQHPRPFMISLGHTLIPHAADSSFPSDHLTLLWAVAFSFLMHRSPRLVGMALASLGLPVAWARIYLGVHFPLDMVGAALVAWLSAWLAFREMRVFLPATYRLALSVHRVIFGKLIQIGWVRK